MDRKLLVIGRGVFFQKGIGLGVVVNASQSHFLNQAILKGLIGPLHPAFGFWRIGTKGLNPQLRHGTAKLCAVVVVLGLLMLCLSLDRAQPLRPADGYDQFSNQSRVPASRLKFSCSRRDLPGWVPLLKILRPADAHQVVAAGLEFYLPTTGTLLL